MKTLQAALAFTALLAASGFQLRAEELQVEIDPSQSGVEFTLGDVLHTVHGNFKVKGGSIGFDPETNKASGKITVDVGSGDSGGATRDRRMHKDILESQRFPDAVFAPDRIVGKLAAEGASDVSIHGVFTIHSAAHEVTLPANVRIENGRLTATATLQMPYVKWGMKNPSTFILRVNDTVQLEMHVSGSIHPKAS